MTLSDDIRIINEGLAWLKANKPEQYEQSFFQIVDGRRRLRRQLRALEENLAVGAFGESQTGKSYQINTLLNRHDKAFRIKADSHPDGVGFVDDINPIGDDREATGVVTRLTGFRRHPERYRSDWPVIVRLLNVGQLTAILSSGYFTNIRDYTTYSDDELRAIADLIKERYANRPEQSNRVLTEDDVLDIKSYLANYVEAPTQSILRSKYFETLTRVISRVPVSELSSVLKYLWHENEVITRLFERLMSVLARFDYARDIYLPLEAVMHHNENRRTILSVACLNGLDDEHWDITTDVMVPIDGDPSQLRLQKDIATCDICAVSAEVVFKIDDEYLNEDRQYFYDDARAGEPGFLSRSSHAKLSATVNKSLLAQTDLLDFPGARSPEQQDEAFIAEGNCDQAGQSVLVKLFLRGKIAYLFNH